MRIEHVGLWVHDLEQMKAFYQTMFQATAGELYENHKKGFQSYFLTFEEGARLEIMHQDSEMDGLWQLKGNTHTWHYPLVVKRWLMNWSLSFKHKTYPC